MKFKNMINMKTLKKILLICIFNLLFISMFFLPRNYAQEWTYNGVDTEVIPNHSVYPSEWYIYEIEAFAAPDDLQLGVEINHGNVTYLFGGNGTCVWANGYWMNTTTGGKTFSSMSLISYWNETIGFMSFSFPTIIPVANDGKVSPAILDSLSVYLGMFLTGENLENSSIYESIYSIAFWNESFNDAYVYFNWTDDGVLAKWESNIMAMGNLTLYSQPAQLPPVFSFSTEDDILIVNSTDIDLKVAITAADNNNDEIIDTDYQYRVLNGSTWTSWASVPPLIDIDLGSVPAGNYMISMEVKNMYGITQEQIELQYDPSGNGGEDSPEIPGYSTLLISIAFLIGISFLIFKNRKRK